MSWICWGSWGLRVLCLPQTLNQPGHCTQPRLIIHWPTQWLHSWSRPFYCSIFFFFKKHFKFSFIHWLCLVFTATCGFSSSWGKWGLLFLAVNRLLIAVVFSCGRAHTPECRLSSRGAQACCLAVCRSSQTRARSPAPALAGALLIAGLLGKPYPFTSELDILWNSILPPLAIPIWGILKWCLKITIYIFNLS